VDVTYELLNGSILKKTIFRNDEPKLAATSGARTWSFDAKPAAFKLGQRKLASCPTGRTWTRATLWRSPTSTATIIATVDLVVQSFLEATLRIRTQIEKLREYRQALISVAVTGKTCR
jgi:hypothetical protein